MVTNRNGSNDEELEKNKISIFLNEIEVEEINELKEQIKITEKRIDKLEKHKKILDRKIYDLNNRIIKLNDELKVNKHNVSFSLYLLNNFNREELITILDDFIHYKDYFENPPKEAYEVDYMDYTKCDEAIDMGLLLFKHEIYDNQYKKKLEFMERKYNKREPDEFSKEVLTLDEIFTVLTWINRGEHHCGYFCYEAIKEKTFFNLLSRMEEIRNEL